MADQRPNIILIITDQQRFDTIGALGFDYMDTPHLDRLVNEGITFNQCHIPATSCAPARAALFTGRYPHTTRIFKNGDRWQSTWVADLQSAGYHTVNIGKMHTTPFLAPAGFNERYVVENKDRYLQGASFIDEWDKALIARKLNPKPGRIVYRQRPDYRKSLGAFIWDYDEDLQSDNFVGGFAAHWIEHQQFAGPLFLQIGFPGPHPPYDPTPELAREYADRDFGLVDPSARELAEQPQPLRAMREHNAVVDHDSIVHRLDPTRAQRQHQRACYMANVALIDRQVGNIMAVLSARGLLENAVVIFTSDHGDALGDHGHSQKWTFYDCVTRVPMIVWSPARFTGGQAIEDLYSWIDLAPTIFAIAGLAPPAGFEGISMLPALHGSAAATGREYVFCEQSREDLMGLEWDFMTMVRDSRWKLVALLDSCEGQLFDLENDPGETRNLWSDSAVADQKLRLSQAITNYLVRSNYQTSDWGQQWR